MFDYVANALESAFWVFPLPNGPARRIPGTFVEMWFLQGSNQVAYRHSSEPRHVFASDLDGSHAHSLVYFPEDLWGWFFPDGTKFRYRTNDNKLWESRADMSGKHRILRGFNEESCCQTWPPDGRLFLLASPVENVWNLWAVSESGWWRLFPPSRPTQLTFGPISFQFATSSRDGKQVFALGQTFRGELSLYDGQSGLLRKYLDGISAGFTDFSRDGKWVTYVTHPQGMLWRSRIDGSERQQLTFAPMGPIVNPEWSPDGRFIAFTEWGEGKQNKIYLVGAEGGAPMLLLSGDFMPCDPSWSPDGKSFVYGGAAVISSPGVRSEVRMFDLATKQSRTIPGSPGSTQRAMVARRPSPGRHI